MVPSMQAMPRTTAAVGQRALSAAAALVFGGGFALYQMTSLVLGPPTTRQLHLSLTIPTTDREDRPEPTASNDAIVLGFLSPPVGASTATVGITAPASRKPTTSGAAPTPVPTAKVAPVPTPAPRPSDHGRPAIVPTPQLPRDPEGD
jgi:hypothetical protein